MLLSQRFVRPFCLPVIAVYLVLSNNTYAQADDIGKTIVVVQNVELVNGQSRKKAVKGAAIKQLETVETGKNARGEFVLRDETKLAVGPSSKLLLSKFIYDPDPNARKVVLTNLKGAFRFVTGKSPSKIYKINTPTAVLAVRGTMLDIYVDDKGKTTVALLKGKVNICSARLLKCSLMENPGRFLSVNRLGKFIKATSKDLESKVLGSVPFGEAFPFLIGKNRLRGSLATPGKIQLAIAKGLRIPKLPNILPKNGKLFPNLPSLDILNGKKSKRKSTKKSKTRKKKSNAGLKLKLPKFSGGNIFSSGKKSRRSKKRKSRRKNNTR